MEIYQPHKIAFIGTSSVGKSTIYEWCRREIADSGCAVIDEAATIYFGAHNVPEELRFTEETQSEIQSLAIGAELTLFAEATRRGLEFAFLDRCALDAPVYVRSTGDMEGSNRLYTRMRPFLSTYSRLYLLDPSGVPFQQNDIRREGEAQRNLIHETYLEFLAEKGIKYELLSGTEKKRKRTVSEYVVYLAMGGVRDNVSGSLEDAMRDKPAEREGKIFNMMCTVLGAIRPRDEDGIGPLPSAMRDRIEMLLIKLHLDSLPSVRGSRQIQIARTIAANDQALRVVLSQLEERVPLQRYSLGEARARFRDESDWQVREGEVALTLPTKIEGLHLKLQYPDNRTTPSLAFILEDLG